jgi:hypothetical protein
MRHKTWLCIHTNRVTRHGHLLATFHKKPFTAEGGVETTIHGLGCPSSNDKEAGVKSVSIGGKRVVGEIVSQLVNLEFAMSPTLLNLPWMPSHPFNVDGCTKFVTMAVAHTNEVAEYSPFRWLKVCDLSAVRSWTPTAVKHRELGVTEYW